MWPHGRSCSSPERSRLVQAAARPNAKDSTGPRVLVDTPAQKFLTLLSLSLFSPHGNLFWNIFVSQITVVQWFIPHFFFFTNQRDIYLPIRISDQYWIISFIILRWYNFSREQRGHFQLMWLSTNFYSVGRLRRAFSPPPPSYPSCMHRGPEILSRVTVLVFITTKRKEKVQRLPKYWDV